MLVDHGIIDFVRLGAAVERQHTGTIGHTSALARNQMSSCAKIPATIQALPAPARYSICVKQSQVLDCDHRLQEILVAWKLLNDA